MADHRDVNVYLDDILKSIDLIQAYTLRLNWDDFQENIEKQDAILRRLEIIGEAVKQIPEDFCLLNSNVPWKKVAGLRDVVIHRYFGISPKLIWNIIVNDLPVLKEQIVALRLKMKN